jgi:uncharacterized protein YqfA (UPF0365 family)
MMIIIIIIIIMIIIIIIIIISLCQCGQGCCPGGFYLLDIGLDHIWGLQSSRVIKLIIINNYYNYYNYFNDTSQATTWLSHHYLASPLWDNRAISTDLLR